jgi:CTP:phosphocholine cytidylyltransferase-like protein
MTTVQQDFLIKTLFLSIEDDSKYFAEYYNGVLVERLLTTNQSMIHEVEIKDMQNYIFDISMKLEILENLRNNYKNMIIK